MRRKALVWVLCLCVLLGSAGVIFAANTEMLSSTQGSEMQLVQAEAAAPAQPTGLKAASTGYNSIRFTWNQVSGAEGYFVYRKSGKGSWKKIAQTTSGSYQDSGLTTGTAYTYTVRAYIGAGGEQVLSAYDKTGATATPVPAAVKLGKATVSGSSIKITWSKTAGANGYCIYRKNPGGSWKKIKTVGNTTTSYTDQNLKIGTYIYTIRAYRKVGKDTVLGAYDSTGITGSIAPAKPKLSSAAASTSGVTVKWSKVSGANGYRVYRKNGSQSWTRIATVQSTSTISYTDAKVNSGVKYTYTVRAYTNTGNTVVLSGYDTKGISVTAKAPIGATTLSGISASDKGVTVSWEQVKRAEGYCVYRKNGSAGWKKIASVKGGSTLSYQDRTVDNGVRYTYTVRAYITVSGKQELGAYDGAGVQCNAVSAVLLAADRRYESQNDVDLYLFWEAAEGADGYALYSKSPGGSWKRFATLSGKQCNTQDNVCAVFLGKKDVSSETVYTVRSYRTVSGKELLGSYSALGCSTEQAAAIQEILSDFSDIPAVQ